MQRRLLHYTKDALVNARATHSRIPLLIILIFTSNSLKETVLKIGEIIIEKNKNSIQCHLESQIELLQMRTSEKMKMYNQRRTETRPYVTYTAVPISSHLKHSQKGAVTVTAGRLFPSFISHITAHVKKHDFQV